MALPPRHKSAAEVIKRPLVSEKASLLNAGPAGATYVFRVAREVTKPEIAAAIKELYGVSPRKVTTSSRAGEKKAMVMLKKGETLKLL